MDSMILFLVMISIGAGFAIGYYKGRSALEQHLKTLQALNQDMAEEAKNLTKALTGKWS